MEIIAPFRWVMLINEAVHFKLVLWQNCEPCFWEANTNLIGMNYRKSQWNCMLSLENVYSKTYGYHLHEKSGFLPQHKFHLVVPLSPSDMSLKPGTHAWRLSSFSHLHLMSSTHLYSLISNISPNISHFFFHFPTLTLDQGLANFFLKRLRYTIFFALPAL